MGAGKICRDSHNLKSPGVYPDAVHIHHTIYNVCPLFFLELRNNLTASNATYHAVHDLALTVDSRHQILLTKSRNLLVTANYGNRPHNIETTSLQVQEIANRVLNESKTAHDTSQRMNGNLTALSQTVGNVNVSSTDGNRIMDESLALGKFFVTVVGLEYITF